MILFRIPHIQENDLGLTRAAFNLPQGLMPITNDLSLYSTSEKTLHMDYKGPTT